VDVIAALTDYGISVTIYDPLASPEAVKEYKLVTSNTVPNQSLMQSGCGTCRIFRHGFIEMQIKRACCMT
jgi:hypothetical protein